MWSKNNIKFLDGKDIDLIKRSIKYISPFKLEFVFLFISTVFLLILGIIQPLLMGDIVQRLTYKESNTLNKSIIMLFSLYVIQTIVNYYKNYLSTYLNCNIVYKLKCEMYEKIINLPVKIFDRTTEGEFLSRLNSDVQVLSSVITNEFINVIIDILKVIILGLTVFSINFKLGSIVIMVFPFSYIIFIKFGKLLREKNSELRKDTDEYFSILQQSLHGIRHIKSYGMKDYCYKSFKNISNVINKKYIKISILNNISFALSDFINYLDIILIISVGSYFILIGDLSIKHFIAFNSYSLQLSYSLQNITKLNSNVQQIVVSLERIFNLLDEFIYSNESFGTKKIGRVNGNIKFENVNFQYDGETNILENFNMSIEPKLLTVIVGKNGSGKSTLFNLILRYYTCNTGKITIDDIKLEEFDENSLRKNVAILHQELFFFKLSVKENIRLAVPNALDEDIFEACKQAYIHDYIEGLPEGYNTIIEENGVNFSGGQKQRIAIARCFLKKSPIVLLDEPTSALDNESKYYIKKAIINMSKYSAVILISHDLDLISEADQIIVLEDGKVVGKGKHDNLLRENLVYKNLYEEKFKMQLKEDVEVI